MSEPSRCDLHVAAKNICDHLFSGETTEEDFERAKEAYVRDLEYRVEVAESLTFETFNAVKQ